jgi:hypothetical protein
MAPTDSIYATTHYRIAVQLEELLVNSENDSDAVEEIDISLENIEEIHDSDISLDDVHESDTILSEDEDGFVEFLLCTESPDYEEEIDETPRSSLQTCERRLVFARRRLFSSDEEGDSEED